MTTERIRIATEDDIEAFHTLLYKSFQSIRDLGIDWPSANASRELVLENITNYSAYVLEVDGKLVSTITIRFPWESETPVSKYPFVWWFGTDPEYASKGYGNQLLTYIEETLLRDTLKVPALTLGTSARKHPWLLEMYQRKGYEIYFEHESPDGDLGAMLRKVLIPEKFNAALLSIPTF
ncbi:MULTISPECIES: GNAT family N-acetyltransferase [Brochothrix]|uniref:N-acetyltransferase n=1 Tax=Brochothrix thermosphacta TaxID=2756 RepID=A0A1D2KK56_BROTH|nr:MULTISPECIES: GNAT family N-acetyltransferase [Brochothrix]SLN02826.1 acetyltransferase, GNAT family [Brachybacterium faecium]ANZ95359.1 GNAT family N-acetyltransferase [Brochothrix thermosphacta]ANZ96366.1 GNAT family N-acetyltransferase [Brochothrix thermosphacta]ATF25783.1 N-acetyltransferase [Brochothrix thermosphacta]ATH85119.1 N-acetyltransferase [Brochothrix thermosphacta]